MSLGHRVKVNSMLVVFTDWDSATKSLPFISRTVLVVIGLPNSTACCSRRRLYSLSSGMTTTASVWKPAKGRIFLPWAPWKVLFYKHEWVIMPREPGLWQTVVNYAVRTQSLADCCQLCRENPVSADCCLVVSGSTPLPVMKQWYVRIALPHQQLIMVT